MFQGALLAAAIRSAPDILNAARKVYESVSDRRRNQKSARDGEDPESPSTFRARIGELQERVDALEASEVDQADLVSKMAEQEQALVTGLQRLSTRAALQLWVSAVVFAVGIAAIVIASL